jgi:UrcA family protein
MSSSGARPDLRILTAFSSIALLAAAAPALAQTTTDEVVVTGHTHGANDRTASVTVKYHDLDLSTAAGRSALDKRIKAASHKACMSLGEHGMGGTYTMGSCEDEATKTAESQTKLATAKP